VRNLRIIRTARRITDAIRSVVAPAALVRDQAQQAPAVAADPADLYTDDELPPVEEIERAAMQFDLACDNARRADRTKRAAKKLLDKVPSGQFGRYRIFRTPSSRMTPDLAEITRIFKANGLGKVPMKPCADSLKVELLAVPAATATELVAA
jgi:hypothetical protein